MPRPFALIRTEDQWRRVAHDRTALEGEVVHLAWDEQLEAAQVLTRDALSRDDRADHSLGEGTRDCAELLL